jgi:Tfp pilus assembly protein PilF
MASQEYPEDFRPYLAKGLVLKQQGQKGDATRYFIQARYYAPSTSRGAVDAIISQQ